MIGPGVIFSLLIVAVTITIYYLIRSKHIENMAKIEHGIAEEDKMASLRFILNLGIFLCFLGGGFLLAYLISLNSNVPEHITMPTSLLFSGGLGLILSYVINANISK